MRKVPFASWTGVSRRLSEDTHWFEREICVFKWRKTWFLQTSAHRCHAHDSFDLRLVQPTVSDHRCDRRITTCSFLQLNRLHTLIQSPLDCQALTAIHFSALPRCQGNKSPRRVHAQMIYSINTGHLEPTQSPRRMETLYMASFSGGKNGLSLKWPNFYLVNPSDMLQKPSSRSLPPRSTSSGQSQKCDVAGRGGVGSLEVHGTFSPDRDRPG